MIMGICLREGEMRHVMVVAFMPFFSQVGAIVVLTSPERIGHVYETVHVTFRLVLVIIFSTQRKFC